MSTLSRRARCGTALGLAALLLAAVAGSASAQEPLPGPPARAGHPPIGGPLLTGNHVRYDAGGTTISPPAMDAASWLIADADTGEILAAKGPHLRFRPASTLKTLTALTLMPVLDPTSTYTASGDDARAALGEAGHGIDRHAVGAARDGIPVLSHLSEPCAAVLLPPLLESREHRGLEVLLPPRRVVPGAVDEHDAGDAAASVATS